MSVSRLIEHLLESLPGRGTGPFPVPQSGNPAPSAPGGNLKPDDIGCDENGAAQTPANQQPTGLESAWEEWAAEHPESALGDREDWSMSLSPKRHP